MKIKIKGALTGKYRFRVNIFGKLILQVEERYIFHDMFYSQEDDYNFIVKYRDAKLEDLDMGELK